MKKIILALLVLVTAGANAQINNVSLQASGLTCSLCSKAVKTALEEVSFVERVQVDIKKQQYNLSFKQGSAVDFDALNKAVQDAGFSVASLKVTATVSPLTLHKDEHLKFNGQTLHVLNATGQAVDGALSFLLVDKGFVTAKEFKKYAALTKMSCVQTGRMQRCCAPNEEPVNARIYHVIL